jgi:hypothetical protein
MSEVDKRVIAEAERSNIAAYRWKNRGKAPGGYVKGMALAFVRLYAELESGDEFAQAITVPPRSDEATDCLDWYAEVLSSASVHGETASDRLVQLFTILLGLGIRESSGKHCEGRDMSADNVSADTAEAGLFQVSYNSVKAHTALRALVERYQGRQDLLTDFREGVHCSADSWTNWGEGNGRAFQQLNKECPLFATAYAAFLLRRARKHWGPINRREAEVRPEAAELFRAVQAIITTRTP